MTPSKAYFHCGVNSSHWPCKLHDYYSDSSWQWNTNYANLKEKYSCCEDTVITYVFSTSEVTYSSQTMTVTRQDGMQWTLTRQRDSRGSCKCGFFVASINHTNTNGGLYVVFERFITLFNLISIMSLFFSVSLMSLKSQQMSLTRITRKVPENQYSKIINAHPRTGTTFAEHHRHGKHIHGLSLRADLYEYRARNRFKRSLLLATPFESSVRQSRKSSPRFESLHTHH